ncbi:HSP20 family protein [Peptoclostridium litorale DSM 5388]|uniref:18 kDa heat shock protein n=1 Tax=Peptoclostridium litorale DSM 5388 TaxID=1121324 RepID=A0A069RC07_PEPLI|nr:Hsp20/alpha crystallin family protein [Peptoclostridium litorale]KDR93790.1 18 kDa heat shock protein [Peptoclostridium litorale DSM 5388]SIN85914.1 HSP20 family protein [Peptoclostridium litorale DSM 5388]
MYLPTPFDRKKESLMRYFDKVFEEDFWNFPTPDFFTEGFIRTDIRETETEYILEADLPGFTRDDVKIKIKDNYLILSAEKKQEIEESAEGYIRKERSYGSLKRSFFLENIKEDEISAKFEHGVLTIVLPKSKEEKKEERAIDID